MVKITRERCQEIVDKSDAFYCQETTVNGFQVEMYNYRLASFTDFDDNDAYELRGLTFVNNNGTWERFLAMEKFFNVNQTINWMYDDLKDKAISSISDKLDGSLIQFIRFPDGTVRAKSKMSFTSVQAEMAQKIYDENPNYKEMIDNSISDGYTIIFELTSPFNQVVLGYDDTRLQVLQVRSQDGTYLKITQDVMDLFKDHDISYAEHNSFSKLSLEDLLFLKKTSQNIEGWVVTFTDGQKAKVKTDWYLRLHGIITAGTRENLLIETILEDNIDDVMAQVTGEKLKFINGVTTKVQHKFNEMVVEAISLKDKFVNEFKSDRKEFSLVYSKHELFSVIMRNINKLDDFESAAEASVKEHILKVTNSLGKAKEWLDNISYENHTV